MAITGPPTMNSGLFALPRELRDEVYAFALAVGNISILRLSRQVYEEAQPLIYKNATYRISCNFSDMAGMLAHLQDNNYAEKIQNLDIRGKRTDSFDPYNRHYMPEYSGSRWMGVKWDSRVPRNQCTVRLEAIYGVGDLIAVNWNKMFQKLVGFAVVTLEIRVFESPTATECGELTILKRPVSPIVWGDPFNDLLMSGVLLDKLEWILGPMETKEEGSTVMVFRPRSHHALKDSHISHDGFAIFEG